VASLVTESADRRTDIRIDASAVDATPALDPSQKPQDFTTGRARRMLFSVMINAGASRRRTAQSPGVFPQAILVTGGDTGHRAKH
jgi:hypothetical protein